MANLTETEPVAVAGAATAVVSVVTAGVALAASFGARITDIQKAAIIGFVTAVIALVGFGSSWWARRKSTPVATAQKAVDAAFTATPGVDAKPKL